MKPDKPPPPKRDRDILRARNSKPLKATNDTAPSVPASLSASELSADGTEPSSSTVPSDEVVSNTSSSASSSSSSPPTSSSASSEKDKSAEMKLYLDKLRELVPYVPRSGRISRVQLIHSAIDYITDLQESLEARARRKLRGKQDQASRPPLAALSPAHVETNNRVTPLSENSSNRQPTLLETNTRHPSSLASSSLSTADDIASASMMNLPLSTSNPNVAGSSSAPLIPAAAGPPSPHDPS